ncbi:MAG: helix-turn-helix domain-containing protein, partial [Deltaproteobacteria bacterium]|nr:helix-turn-helix domain-containing protein [Deltaproteobacteria bacterium]
MATPLSVTLNRLGYTQASGEAWTVGALRDFRALNALPEYDEVINPRKTLTTTEAAKRLGISGGTVHRLIDEGILAATQALPGAPWEISPESVESRIA